MREIELAWAAGLFEGEGSIGVDRSAGRYLYPRIQLSMCDEDTVRRFASVVGGKVWGPYRHHLADERGWSSFWSWAKKGRPAALIIDQLWPWLSERRKQKWQEALNACS